MGAPKIRTTIALDSALLETAQKYTGVKEKSALMHEALTALVQREAARRLARLGGSQPDLKRPRAGGRSPGDPGRYLGLGPTYRP